MKKKVIPIIAALELNSDLTDRINFAKSICTIHNKYFLNGIPHITLWMGGVEESLLSKIWSEYKDVFGTISCEIEVQYIELFAASETNSLYSMNVISNNHLEVLHDRVFKFLEPYRKTISFNTLSEFDSFSLSYINAYPSKALSSFDPHITLGFAKSSAAHNLRFNLKGIGRPKLFKGANNCTCVPLRLH